MTNAARSRDASSSWRKTPTCSPIATAALTRIFSCLMRWRTRMPALAQPGEVWRVDFGLAAKVRPALILSDYPADDELALLMVIPHTTAVRGNRWELTVRKPFLKPGAFHLQQIQPIPLVRFDFRLGALTLDEFKNVKQTLIRLLNLQV